MFNARTTRDTGSHGIEAIAACGARGGRVAMLHKISEEIRNAKGLRENKLQEAERSRINKIYMPNSTKLSLISYSVK